MLKQYVDIIQKMGIAEFIAFTLLSSILLSLIIWVFDRTVKGGIGRIFVKIGQVVAVILVTPLSVSQLLIKSVINILNSALMLITGLFTFITLTLELVAQILYEFANFIVKKGE